MFTCGFQLPLAISSQLHQTFQALLPHPHAGENYLGQLTAYSVAGLVLMDVWVHGEPGADGEPLTSARGDPEPSETGWT